METKGSYDKSSLVISLISALRGLVEFQRVFLTVLSGVIIANPLLLKADSDDILYGYASAEVGEEKISYWPQPIFLQISYPDETPKNALISEMARSKIVSYSIDASNDFSVYWGDDRKKVMPGINYFIGIVPGLDDGSGISRNYEDPFDYSENREIPEIYKSRIERIWPGCYGRWRNSSEMKISGFVILVDSDLDFVSQVDCINYLVPLSFGVKPGRLEIGVDDDSQFLDFSPIQKKIRAASLCRNQLNDRSLSCARKVLKSVYGAYSKF